MKEKDVKFYEISKHLIAETHNYSDLGRIFDQGLKTIDLNKILSSNVIIMGRDEFEKLIGETK